MGTLVAVDGGRSRCRAAVIGADGRPGPVAEGPGLPPQTGPAAVEGIVEALAVTVTSAVVAAAAARRGVGRVEALSAGLAGLLNSRELAPAVAARLHQRLGLERVALCGDVVAAHAGALPDPDGGVVVVAGTGAVAFGAVPVKVPEIDGTRPVGVAGPGAVGRGGLGPGGMGVGGAGPGGGIWSFDAVVACVDGWGHLLGDAGSGFWIGRRGLEAALRAHDGRGGSPLLARLAERDLGPLDRLPGLTGGAGPAPVATVASFSVQVAEAARAGDDVARYIWLEAAGALAESAMACARRLQSGPSTPVAVSWTGGLFAAPDPLLLEPFLARIRSTFPAADLLPAAADPLAGAARLATPGARGALAGLVFDSSAPHRAPVTA